MHSEGIGQDRLDDIPVADHCVHAAPAQPGIPLANGTDGTVLHGSHGLAIGAREDCRTGVVLHGAPHGLLGKAGELAARPVAIAAFAEALVYRSLERASGAQCIRCLDGAIQGRRDNVGQRHRRQPHGSARSLLMPALVEEHPRRPAGEDARGVRRGAPVAQEDDGRHGNRVCAALLAWLPAVGKNEPMMRGLAVYAPDRVIDVDMDTDIASALAAARQQAAQIPGAFIWLGLFEPTRAELDCVREAFDLPPLQVDDAANPRQRAKVEVMDGNVLALMKVLDYLESSSDVRTGQLAVFAGSDHVVSVRHGNVGDLRPLRQRLAADARLREVGPFGVLYAVMDHVVDDYLAVTDEITQDIEDVEVDVFEEATQPPNASRLYLLKRENIEIRRAISPLVPWAHEMADGVVDWVPDGMRPYFRDLAEHLLRANDSVEASDNLLMSLMMVSTAMQDLQQNKDMRKISAWVAIAAVPTMIAAIYGMNFDTMPELHEPWGYPAVLGVMALVSFALYRAFKRSGWL